MNIIEITEYSDDVLESINNLLPQLSSSAMPLTVDELTNIINSESSHLLMAKNNGKYYGSLTLVVFRIPTGIRAWIEDLVVSENARGRGIGKELTKYAIILSKKAGAKTIDLTSRSSRIAANSLYTNSGFKRRETNVYRRMNT